MDPRKSCLSSYLAQTVLGLDANALSNSVELFVKRQDLGVREVGINKASIK